MSNQGPRNPASYCFAQQTDNSCHLMPFINLGILSHLRQKSLATDQEINLNMHAKWFNKRHWFPQTFLWTKNWQQAISRAKNTPFGDYQKVMFENGVISGHVYDKNGNNYLKTWDPLENYARLLLVPYNFTDATTLSEDFGAIHANGAYKSLPIFWDQGKAIGYDPKKEDYIDLEEVSDQNAIDQGDWDIAIQIIPGTSMCGAQSTSQTELEPHEINLDMSVMPQTQIPVPVVPVPVTPYFQSITAYRDTVLEQSGEFLEKISQTTKTVTDFFTKTSPYRHQSTQLPPGALFANNKNFFRFYKLSPAQKVFFELPKNTILNHFQYSQLGYEMGFKYRYLPEQAEINSYYMCSIFQLMLFCMGVDRDNQPIDEKHPLFEAHTALKKEMTSSGMNPWALPSFKKENLLEYQIAKMIQADPVLKQKMKETVNIFYPAWEYYKALDNLYDSPDPHNRRSLKPKKQWLLGEDLYLAYVYAMNARFLWAAATSRNAFNAVLELDPMLSTLLRLPFAPGPNQLMSAATKKSPKGISFLDVWQEVQGQLVVNPTIPKELASFSGHGMVVSLYSDLVTQQMKNGVQNPYIMNRLGFAVIDSYYGEQLSPMYRNAKGNESAETCEIQQLTGQTCTQKSIQYKS